MLWDETYGFSFLSEKTRKSNRLQMSSQRQHFLLSYLKTLSVGQAGIEPATPAQQLCALPWNCANHTAPLKYQLNIMTTEPLHIVCGGAFRKMWEKKI